MCYFDNGGNAIFPRVPPKMAGFRHKKKSLFQGLILIVAGVKGLEPSTFCVTGRRSNQAELHPQRRESIYIKL